MPETVYEDHRTTHGVYELIHSIDKNVRDTNSELYIFRRETAHSITELQQRVTRLETAGIQHDKAIDRLQNDVTELKQEVKALREDVGDMKGDLKAIAAGFGAAQNRFNWGLIILGLFVALIQLLK